MEAPARRRVLAALTAVAASGALLAGLAGPAAEALGGPERPAPRVSPGIAWGDCPTDLAGGHLRCGTLTVPLDRQHPELGTTVLGVSLAQADGPGPRRGTILVNPGGPGGGGMWLAAAVHARLPRDVRAAYDVVGVDPRGNAHSSPVHCTAPGELDRAPKPDPVPHDAAGRDVLLARARAFADDCAAHAGPLLAHMGTVENAQDLDDVRAALGEPRISYLGWSYGTYLGAVYATLFPSHVDHLILDSIVDPRPDRVWYADNLAQNEAFQGRWDDFAAWAAGHDDVFGLGTHAEAVTDDYTRIRASLAGHPAQGVVGPAELDDIATDAMYNDARWTALARALHAFLGGDPGPLAALYTPPTADDENSTAVYNAVECRDAPWPAQWGTWQRDADWQQRHDPLLTWPNTWLNAPCLFWPVPPRKPVTVTGAGLGPVLLVQGTRDGATPLSGGLAMHAALPTSRLVTVLGQGNHGVFLFSPNACVTEQARAYLMDETPAATGDTTCKASPEPDPATS